MIVFFDIGKKGAVSIFKAKKLKKCFFYDLSKNKKMSAKAKMMAFEKFLIETFPHPDIYEKVGAFEPFGKNFKTVMNLSFLIALIIRHFYSSKVYLLNEWEIWRETLKNSKIPLRKEKKQMTIDWAKNKFKIQINTDDEADAILGAFYLSHLNL